MVGNGQQDVAPTHHRITEYLIQLNKENVLMKMGITSEGMFLSWRTFPHLKFMNHGCSLMATARDIQNE
jgi:hypothetical protein